MTVVTVSPKYQVVIPKDVREQFDLTEGANASVFGEPIEEIDHLIVPSMTLLEVFKFVLRRTDETSALEVIAAMRQGQVIDLDGELALLAGKLGRGAVPPAILGIMSSSFRPSWG